MSRAWAVVVVAAVLAGCLGGPSHPADAVAPPPTVVHGQGTIAGSVSMQGMGGALGGNATPFTLASNVTLLYVEIAWDDPVQDIDLALASPDAGTTGNAQNYDYVQSGGAPGSPDSPHSLTIVSPTAGDWQASAFADGAAAMVDYRVAITMFHGESVVPAGYTALS